MDLFVCWQVLFVALTLWSVLLALRRDGWALKTNYLRLSAVRVLFVLDEADNMVDERALVIDTLDIRKKLPADCQTLLFSATYSEKVSEL